MCKEVTECNGFEAIFQAALDSAVSIVTGVPGYPITSLMELFLQHEKELQTQNFQNQDFQNSANYSTKSQNSLPYSAKWLTNEKVALEIALGASVSGKRGLVIVKHVGMNLLSDPLITSVTHTIGAGLVVLAGDDPGIKGSQNAQDSRWYGKIAETAVFDPGCPDAAYRALRRAYELSEEAKVPVIIRVTADLEKTRGKIKLLPPFSGKSPKFDRSIWELRMREKHQHFHKEIYPLLEKEAENTDLNFLTAEKCMRQENKIGIISSGFASFLVEKVLNGTKEKNILNSGEISLSNSGEISLSNSGEVSLSNSGEVSLSNCVFNKRTINSTISLSNSGEVSLSNSGKISLLKPCPRSQITVSHMILNLVNPLPIQKIQTFLERHQRILVVEESEPFIEEQISISGKVYGKKTDHLPYGQIRAEDIEFALESIREETIEKTEITEKAKKTEKTEKSAEIIRSSIPKTSRTSICEDCPYLPLYRLLRTLDVRVAGDMGCSIRSAPQPLAAVDASFALGSAISVACGFEKKGIAVIGDFALAHSGILGLLTAVREGYDVLVLVLQNEVAAMTGGQEVPDLKEIVQAIARDVSVIDISENEISAQLSALITQKLECSGVSVIFVRGKCRRY